MTAPNASAAKRGACDDAPEDDDDEDEEEEEENASARETARRAARAARVVARSIDSLPPGTHRTGGVSYNLSRELSRRERRRGEGREREAFLLSSPNTHALVFFCMMSSVLIAVF